MLWLQQLSRFLTSARRPALAALATTRDGIEQASGDHHKHLLSWTEVTRIIGYKRDCFAYDQLCLAVLTATQEYHFCEDQPGWQELADALPHALPGALAFEGWFLEVAFPAFEPNVTVIYDRAHPEMQGRLR